MDNVIDVRGLSKSFHGKPAVVNTSLTVKPGEVFGFLGPNGSGKTTTIRMLCGLLTPDSGEGTCLGYDVIKDSRDIKKHVGYMTQKFSLYGDLTVEENLQFMASMYRIVNQRETIEKNIHEMGLQHYRKQIAGTLSGGWKQRLALTAALLHRPQLLLLDEPTAGVDPKARREFWDHVHRLASEGMTALVSTHYMDEAERCTKLAYIAHGHILAQGREEEIIDQSGLNTWKITRYAKESMIADLKQLTGVEQAVLFGKEIHVSGRDANLLEKSLQSLQLPADQLIEIKPSLEDVFIMFSDATPEEVAS